MYCKKSNPLYHLFFILIFTNIGVSQIDDSQNCEMVKLSYIKSDYATGVLKAMGHNVIEFESEAGETETEFSFSPSSIIDKNKLTIIKMPENNSVSLSSLTPNYDEDDEGGESIAASLGGSSFSNTSSGEPLQRLMVCYPSNQFKAFSKFYQFLKNEIDVAADQILIEALVIEIDSEKLNEFDLGLTDYNNPANDGGQIAVSTPSIDATTGSYTNFLLQYSTGGFFDEDGNAISKLLDVNLKALLSSKSAEILSKPSVLVLDGRQARIQVGRQIPIIKQIVGASSDILGSDVEYIPVGISLNLKPRISEDKRDVTMQVETIITEVEPQANIDAPTINNRRVESFIRVANNTPFIIGGLISDKKSDAQGSIPLLSKIPFLGKLFSSSSVQHAKKEVIVVITPHVISEEHNRYSRVIPKDSEMFDSVDNRLFPNSYRLKESDIFDLNFITSHQKIEGLTELSHQNADNIDEELRTHIQNGGIPGEDVLVRRMLYNIIERENYFSYVNPSKVIYFDSEKGGGVTFLHKHGIDYLENETKGLLLKYTNKNVAGNDEFVRPSAKAENVTTNSKSYKSDLIGYNDTAKNDYAILLNSSKNRRRLFEILVLKEVLSMNPDLKLQINTFNAGVEIQFPAHETLEVNTHVIDPEVAKYFYEINDYYAAFQQQFNNAYSKLEGN
ncbi:MAG: type II and III secretion system protein [Candidatus Marinimicrobia bacterium]|nr:type II and III secretion system protein [Candidatus Neomarinimicrobiota bacterium]